MGFVTKPLAESGVNGVEKGGGAIVTIGSSTKEPPPWWIDVTPVSASR